MSIRQTPQPYRVECDSCGWFNESRDQGWTEHAGWVHVSMLKPGHVLREAA